MKPRARRREIRAERFLLEDKDGRVRAELKTAADGSPHLVFLDAGGKPTVSLSGWAPSFQLFDRENKLKISLVIAPDGHPALILNGSHGGADVHVSSMPRGPKEPSTAGLVILGNSSKAKIMLCFGEDGDGTLLAMDRDGVEIPCRTKPQARPRKRRQDGPGSSAEQRPQ